MTPEKTATASKPTTTTKRRTFVSTLHTRHKFGTRSDLLMRDMAWRESSLESVVDRVTQRTLRLHTVKSQQVRRARVNGSVSRIHLAYDEPGFACDLTRPGKSLPAQPSQHEALRAVRCVRVI